MAKLHLVRQSAFSTTDFFQCTLTAHNSDTIVLIDDGCYNANHPLLEDIATSKPEIKIYALDKHIIARAIKLPEQIQAIEMKTLIELTFKLDTVITWQ